MDSAWESKRLIYRAVEKSDEDFLLDISLHSTTSLLAAPHIPKPPGSTSAEGYRGWLDSCLLGVVICLASSLENESDKSNRKIFDAQRIGVIALDDTSPRTPHIRVHMLGIHLAPEYQGHGYGSEAIDWALEWGFRRANMHKIYLGTSAFNERALKTYKKLGFTQDGINREHLWHDGRYWDEYIFSMLAREWWERRKRREADEVEGAAKGLK